MSKVCIYFSILVILCLSIIGCGKESNPNSSSEPQKAAATNEVAKSIPFDVRTKLTASPENLDGINGYILSAIEDKYQSKTTVDVEQSTNTPGGYLVEVTTVSDDLNLEQSKNMSRDVMLAMYDAIYEKNLPVIYVSFRTENAPGKRLFIIGIGKNVAGKINRDKWNIHSGDAPFSVDEMINFARSNQEQAITSDGKTHFENRCFLK